MLLIFTLCLCLIIIAGALLSKGIEKESLSKVISALIILVSSALLYVFGSIYHHKEEQKDIENKNTPYQIKNEKKH